MTEDLFVMNVRSRRVLKVQSTNNIVNRHASTLLFEINLSMSLINLANHSARSAPRNFIVDLILSIISTRCVVEPNKKEGSNHDRYYIARVQSFDLYDPVPQQN